MRGNGQRELIVPDKLHKVHFRYDPINVSGNGNFYPILREGLVRVVSAANKWLKDTGNDVHCVSWYPRDPGEVVYVMRDRNAALLLKLSVG